MKKIILALFVALATCTCAFAQKGTSAAGINLGYGIGLNGAKLSNVDIAAKYQYNVLDALRLEAFFDYGIGLKKTEKIYDFEYSAKMNVMTYGINAHWIINPNSTFKVYPIVGIGGGTLSADGASSTGFMYNAGLGGEYGISENAALSLEVKYQAISKNGTYSRLPIQLGFSYKF